MNEFVPRSLEQQQSTSQVANNWYPSPSPTPKMIPRNLPRRPERRQANHSGRPVAKRRIKLLLTYGVDWIVTILIIGLFYLLDGIEGYKREFSMTDASIQYTHFDREIVQTWALFVIALVAPFIIMSIVNLFTLRSWWDLHNSCLGLILGLATAGSLTQIVKVTVGRPRPDLIARCQPKPGTANAPLYGLVTAAVCTQTDNALLKDGFRSFFSGHCSLSFAGLGFLSFYLAGKLHLFDERGHTGKAWIALAPLTGALLVAISRTMDNNHHWQDVIVGSLVGLVLGYFSYRQYYPSLVSPFSHRPYSPRVPRFEQDEAGIPSPHGTPTPLMPGLPPHGGESIEMAGTVKRGGEDLSQTWRRDRDEEHAYNQGASTSGDASRHV